MNTYNLNPLEHVQSNFAYKRFSYATIRPCRRLDIRISLEFSIFLMVRCFFFFVFCLKTFSTVCLFPCALMLSGYDYVGNYFGFNACAKMRTAIGRRS